MGQVFSVHGRIEHQIVDVVVNSAHPSLLHGSGVCGAIHREAGKELESHCRAIGGCEVGSLVSTPGFGLKAPMIIHAVTPRLRPVAEPDTDELLLLDSLFRKIFVEAQRLRAKSVAVPAIGMGGHRFPPRLVMPILARACLAAARVIDLDVYFVSTEQSHVALFQSHVGPDFRSH